MNVPAYNSVPSWSTKLTSNLTLPVDSTGLRSSSVNETLTSRFLPLSDACVETEAKLSIGAGARVGRGRIVLGVGVGFGVGDGEGVIVD